MRSAEITQPSLRLHKVCNASASRKSPVGLKPEFSRKFGLVFMLSPGLPIVLQRDTAFFYF